MGDPVNVQFNKDKFEQVAKALGWVSQRDRNIEGWNEYVVFNGTHGRRYSVNFHSDHYTVSGMKTQEFETHGGYLGDDARKLADTVSRMSVKKSAEALAKEIQRRVIAPYEIVWAIMQNLAEQSKNYVNKTAAQAQVIGGILGATVKGVSLGQEGWIKARNEEIRLSKYFPGGPTLDIRFYEDSARWEYVSFPADLHEKICRVIADHFKAGA